MSDITLQQLPLDVLVKIFGNLSYRDLLNVMLTCKSLRDLIINEHSVWRLAGRNNTIIHNTSDSSQAYHLSSFSRCRISNNWTKGIYHRKIALYHQTNYMPWVTMYQSSLIISTGSELRCFYRDSHGIPSSKKTRWKLNVPTVKRNDVRTNDISRFVVKDGLIVCGNRDGCVAVFIVGNGRQRPNLLHHIRDCHENGQVEVTAVEVMRSEDKQYVVTASQSSSKLCFWGITIDLDAEYTENIECSSEISLSNNVGIRCLHINSNSDNIAVGLNGNSKPLLIDTTTGQLVLGSDTANNPRQAVRDIRWHNENAIMYVTHSGFLQLLDVRSKKVMFSSMDPFQSTLYCVKSDGHNSIVVGSSEYCRCVLFDARRPSRHIQMYFTQKHSSPIYSLDFDSTKLFAAADRSLAILNFEVCSSTAKRRDYSQTFEFVNR